MLTNELLRVKRSGPLVTPRFLTARDRARLEDVARTLIGVLASQTGQRRQDVERALAAVEHLGRDRWVVQGLCKLLLDRADMRPGEGVDPCELRTRLFAAAAAERRGLAPGQAFDRAQVVARVGSEHQLTKEALEERLFADLRANERLVAFEPISASALLGRYDVALAQGVIARATSVEVALESEEPGRLRQLFRAARFFGLLYRIRRLDQARYLVELDGPFSLFSAVQKYGLKLAAFLPSVLRCRRWRLRANVLWGKSKEPLVFELGPEAGLEPPLAAATGVSPDVAGLEERFATLGSRWRVERNDDVVSLPGELVCVPDLLFTHADTGEQVYLEAFGFWSRKAVWQRIEAVERGFPGRIILAVPKRLRVSEEMLEQSDAGDVYVYRTSMRPSAILARLERSPGAGVPQGGSRAPIT